MKEEERLKFKNNYLNTTMGTEMDSDNENQDTEQKLTKKELHEKKMKEQEEMNKPKALTYM